MKSFALIGAAGYVAPKHMKAIADTQNDLVAAMDTRDSVGIIDSYFPKADFFVEFERFDRHLELLKRKATKIDYVSVCTPNYLHDAHIRFGLRYGADVICEKPVVLNPWNIEALQDMEKETGCVCFSILQFRLHPDVVRLKNKVLLDRQDKKYDIELSYITARGNWYYTSWKGDVAKSGGIATNIGIHFFDMLIWVFGKLQSNVVHVHTHDRAAGILEFERARVKWFLSINGALLPREVQEKKMNSYRALTIDNELFVIGGGFEDLHSISYEKILNGKGFRLSETKESIELIHQIRQLRPIGLKGEYHSLAKVSLSEHPFQKHRQ